MRVSYAQAEFELGTLVACSLAVDAHATRKAVAHDRHHDRRPHNHHRRASRLAPAQGRRRIAAGTASQDGSVPDAVDHADAAVEVAAITEAIPELAPLFPHDAAYLRASSPTSSAGQTAASACRTSSTRCWPSSRSSSAWTASVTSSCSRCTRRTGRRTGYVEALIVEVIWPEFIAELEAGDYSNKLFVSLRLVDFTPRLRHELGRAVPRDRGDARDPDVHVGRDLPGSRGRALPARRARGSRDHEARPPRRRGADAGRPGARRGARS